LGRIRHPRRPVELTEGHGPETLGDGFKQALNDFGKPGCAGPCPPKGHGTHHYHFRLMALSEPSLPLISSAMLRETARELDAATRKSEVDEEAELSRRKQPAPLVIDGGPVLVANRYRRSPSFWRRR
jgi:hypothetical protein